MRFLMLTLLSCLIAFLSACGSSPSEKRDVAEARYLEEQTKTLQEYKACIKKAGDKQPKLDACELILKAANPPPANAPVETK